MLLAVSTVRRRASATLDQDIFTAVPPSRGEPRLHDGLSKSSREVGGGFLLLGGPGITEYAEEIIGDHQCVFRSNRPTIDHIFCIRQILEKKWE